MSDRVDGLGERRKDGPREESDQMDNLVTKALGLLAERRVPARSQLSEHFVFALRDAVLSEDGARRQIVLRRMQEAKISVSEIIDYYIPEVSRRLGADWHDNRRSFADVTIGTARLQSILRDLSERDGLSRSSAIGAHGVAVVVREGEFHTLGAMVLAQQIRRLGVSVQLVFGQSDGDVLQVLAQDEYDAILLSVSRREALSDSKRLVDKIRAAIINTPPIVVGGHVVKQEEEVLALTGADHLARDATDALLKCGLKTSLNGASKRASPE